MYGRSEWLPRASAALCILTAVSLLCSDTVSAQTVPSLSGLLSFIPADATSVTIRATSLDETPYAIAQSNGASTGATNAIYGWNNGVWSVAYDVSPFATNECQSDLLAGYPSNSCSPYVGSPTLLSRPSYDTGNMPEMVAFTIGYAFPPTNASSTVLVIIAPSPNGMAPASITSFGVYGVNVNYVERLQNQVQVEADGYMPGDSHCCPSGFEYIVLTWDGTQLVQTARCKVAQRVSSTKACG
jgi:hypothetical protein